MRIGKKPEQDRIVVIKEDPGSGVIPGVLLGIAVGVAVGLLRSPASGSEMRTRVRERLNQGSIMVRSKVSAGTQAAKGKLPGQ